MKLFDFFKAEAAEGQFVSEKAFSRNRDKLIEMTPQTLDQLRDMDVPGDRHIRLEYTFYTNSPEKAGRTCIRDDEYGLYG